MKPNFYKQIDSRWATNRYKCTGGTMSIGGGGCGPTSIANIVSVLTKEVTPVDVMKYVCKQGYMIANQGTTWDGITKTLKHYGIDKFTVTYSAKKAKECLKKKMWVLTVVGKSRWTRGGHYIVIYGITSSNKLLISDPASYSDYRQKDGSYSEYSEAMRCAWICINPEDYIKTKAKPKTSKKVTLYVSDSKANIRKGRGKEYGVVAKIKRGTKLTLTSYKNGWYKIDNGEYKNYYIKGSTLSKYEPYVMTFKTLYVMNVRKGYTTKSGIIKTIKKGTKIKSAYRVGNWIYVPSIKGWVCVKNDKQKFLKKV